MTIRQLRHRLFSDLVESYLLERDDISLDFQYDDFRNDLEDAIECFESDHPIVKLRQGLSPLISL